MTLQFTEEYPNKPPTVRFVSRMFHPNSKLSFLIYVIHGCSGKQLDMISSSMCFTVRNFMASSFSQVSHVLSTQTSEPHYIDKCSVLRYPLDAVHLCCE
jgi:hypothetical protein